MYEGCIVELQMGKMLLAEGILKDTLYHCDVVEYNEEEECIYLILEEYSLMELSLDAKYQCHILSEGSVISCSGMIKDRYQSSGKNIVVFQVEKGFYKSNINEL